MANKHAEFSPSASERNIACPGSVALSRRCPKRKTGPAAKEGTAAHYLCDKCLNEGKDADSITLKYVVIENGEKIAVTAEMLEAVQVYLDYARGLKVDRFWHEKEVDVEYIVKGCFGTADFIGYDVATKRVHIVDFKYGRGVEVEAEWNSQLMIYALGALKLLHSESPTEVPDTCVLHIVQPRIPKDELWSSWEISCADLLYWGLNVLRPAALASMDDNAPRRTGEHCRWCPALVMCPENKERMSALIKADFDAPTTPDISKMTPVQLAKVLKAAGIVRAFAEEVQEYAQAKAELGETIPGYKLVRSRSNRIWRDEEKAKIVLEEKFGKEAYERKFVTPAKAEKLCKAKKVPDSILAELVIKPEAGLSLVAESDRRQAVDVSKPEIDLFD